MMMKKALSLVLIFALVLALSASFFACDSEKPTPTLPSKDELAADVVHAAFPDTRDDEDEIASSLLSLIASAELDDVEAISLLTALKEEGAAFAALYLDVKDNVYSGENAKVYHDALTLVSTAVGSANVAGRLYYAAAKRFDNDITYTLSDCEKLAPLILGQDTTLVNEILDSVLNGEAATLGEKDINTLLVTLVSGLRKAVGISAEAKDFLYTVATDALDAQSNEGGLSEEMTEVLEKNRSFLRAMLAALLDGYDEIISFAADVLDQADARLFIGLPYEKEERVLYYGYNFDDWSKTMITKEEYETKSGGYDDYLAITSTVKGFTVEGNFIVIEEKDAELADNAYRLYTAYTAYSLLDDTVKASLRLRIENVLTVLQQIKEEEEETEPTEHATFDELIAAILPLSTFDATDGISEKEREDARAAVDSYESFLGAYLPDLD